MRLDPFALPLVSSHDKAADERIRSVELTRERVVMRRAGPRHQDGGSSADGRDLGVAIRLQPPADGCPATITIDSENTTIRAFAGAICAPDAADVAAEWQSWGAFSVCRSWSPNPTETARTVRTPRHVETAEPAARRRRLTVMEERGRRS